MDKQEIIERLNNKLSETLKFQQIFEPLSEGHSGCESRANAFMTAINYVEQLDEPQKVKVPAFVAGWIEWSQNHKWALSNVVDASNIKYFEDHSEPTGLTSWFVKKGHDEILARAWLDGYEAEEEPRWMVKSNQLYFTGVTQLIAHDPLTYNFVKDQKHAHIFDDKKSAEKEASYFNGTIEKVEE